MNEFFCEIFCTKTISESEKFKTELVKNDELDYCDLYRHDRIQNIVNIAHMFEEIFGVLPSKPLISEILEHGEKDLIKSIEFVLKTRFNQVQTTPYRGTVKHMLIRLLAHRHHKPEFDVNLTIFKLYKEFAANYTIEPFVCPLTNIYISENSQDCITQIDFLSYTLYKNHYLFATLLQKKQLVLLTSPKSFSLVTNLSKKKNIVTCSAAPIQDNVWYSDRLDLYDFPKKCLHIINVNDEFISKHLDEEFFESSFEDYLKGAYYNLYIYKIYSLLKYKCNYEEERRENAVVIVDNRENVLSFISCVITGACIEKDTWNLVFFTSLTAEPFYQKLFDKHGIDVTIITSLDRLNCVQGSFDIEDYNYVMKDPKIWNMLLKRGYKNALIIQDDGMLLRSGIEEAFLRKYDYVGAPWKEAFANPQCVGNGGFSLRNIELSCEIANKKQKNVLFGFQPIPEDVYFAKQFFEDGHRIPTKEEAKRFSSEMILFEDSIGMHKIWGYHERKIVERYFESVLEYHKERNKNQDER